jgi:uncharacterized RDD family membrane protein YckC
LVVSSPQQQVQWLGMLALAVLVMAVLSAMRHRREMSAETLFEKSRLRIAPLGRRLLAGFIDALPVLGTMVVISLQAGEEHDPAQLAEQFQVPSYVSIAIYLLYTTVAEMFWGWTLGKRLCRLRVAMVDGTKPGMSALFARNVLRIVDVTLAFLPLLLIYLSPLRQRIGDIAAETVVVMDEPAADHMSPDGTQS